MGYLKLIFRQQGLQVQTIFVIELAEFGDLRSEGRILGEKGLGEGGEDSEMHWE